MQTSYIDMVARNDLLLLVFIHMLIGGDLVDYISQSESRQTFKRRCHTTILYCCMCLISRWYHQCQSVSYLWLLEYAQFNSWGTDDMPREHLPICDERKLCTVINDQSTSVHWLLTSTDRPNDKWIDCHSARMHVDRKSTQIPVRGRCQKAAWGREME